MFHQADAWRGRLSLGPAYAGAVLLVILFLAHPIASVFAQAADTTKVDSTAQARQKPAARQSQQKPSATVTPKQEKAESKAQANPRISINVDKLGDIMIELYPKEAPKSVERILTLVRSGFYDGLKFHRVELYVVQTGAAESNLPPVEGEMFGEKLTHEEGMVGMARLPNDYDSARTQFYICKKHLPLMNGEYTLFGKVIEGMKLVHKIKKGDTVKSVKVVE